VEESIVSVDLRFLLPNSMTLPW